MRKTSSWAPRGVGWVASLVLVAALFAVPAAAQITITQWDLPSQAGVPPGFLITEKVGSPASPQGAVWYSTTGDCRLIRFVPASPPDSGPALWTSWNLEPIPGSAVGLKVSPDGVVFVRTQNDLQRIDANTNLRTRWGDQLPIALSDLALDDAGRVYTAGGGILERLTPTGAGGANLTRWNVDGGAGNLFFSGVAFNPTNGRIYYSEPSANNIGELDPATNMVRRFSLAGVAGVTPLQIAVDFVDGNLMWAVTGNNKVIRLNLFDNTLTAFNIPSPNSTSFGVSGGDSPFIGFTEVFGSRFGILNSPGSAAPVPVTPSTATVTPTTSSINATPFVETPLTGTAAPSNFAGAGTTTGDFVEVPLPAGSFLPLGVDCDQLGTFLQTWYFASRGGAGNNRVSRIELQQ